jgi:hypothetical protein
MDLQLELLTYRYYNTIDFDAELIHYSDPDTTVAYTKESKPEHIFHRKNKASFPHL